MPLPFIFGAISLAYGAKKGYDGHQKHSEADNIVNTAKRHYEEARTSFDNQLKATRESLEILDQEKKSICLRFNEFNILADELLQELANRKTEKIEINTPYSRVMALGATSTCINFSILPGSTTTRAFLSAIISDHLAMATSTSFISSAIVAPVMAVTGWAYNNHGEKAIRNANKIRSEVSANIAKLRKAQEQLKNTEGYVFAIIEVLKDVEVQFNKYFNTLTAVSKIISTAKDRRLDLQNELDKLDNAIISAVSNGYALAAILVNLMTTPLFRVKNVDGEIIKDINGEPVMDMDENGSMIINAVQLDNQLNKTKTSLSEIGQAQTNCGTLASANYND